jgi:lipoate-protein ligase A
MCPEVWRLLDYSRASPFENLAIDEAMARNAGSKNFRPTIRFWINPKSVILGRFQNPSTEVNTLLCRQKGIQVARRFTGGGAVFHDEGNLNFTLVTQHEIGTDLAKLNETSYAIILDALRSVGVTGSLLPPNSIVVGDKKVSGAAGALGRGFALWHSSILVSTNIDTLELVLAPSREEIETHYVHSRWHAVTNLQNASSQSVSVNEVKSYLTKSAQKILRVKFQADRLSEEEEALFRELYGRKYSSPDWNENGSYREIQEGVE